MGIESALLSQCTRLQGTLEMSRERLLSTLALIRAGVEFNSKTWSLDAVEEPSELHSKEDDSATLARRLMDDVYSLSSALSKGRLVSLASAGLQLTSLVAQTSPPSLSRLSRCD